MDSLVAAAEMEENVFADLVQSMYADADLFKCDTDSWSWELRKSIIPRHSVSLIEIIRHLPNIRLADFHRYSRDYFKQIRIQALAHGYMDRERAIDILGNITNKVNWSKIDDVILL